jgi:methionyl-tRNA synthetase
MSDAAPATPPPPAAPTPAPPPGPPAISIDDFRKLDLRIGKVLSAEDHPNANKLYVLKVDVGNGEVRQVIAGLREHCPRESLSGRSVVILCNLQPAKLRGLESQGMMLAASGAGTVTVLTPEKEVPPGSKVS